MKMTLMTDMICNLNSIVEVLRRCYGSEYHSLAKCNCIVNLVTVMEVHLRPKALKDMKNDRLLDGDFATNLFTAGARHQDQEVFLSLLEIRNCFIHEGVITEVSDQEIDRFIQFTKSVITA